MLRLLKRWLGWDSDSNLFDFEDLKFKLPRTSERAKPAPPSNRTAKAPTAQPPVAPPHRAKAKGRAPLDVLDNPSLTLDKPPADGFDPYNTGAFNRSTSWEKIGRQRKR